MAAIVLAEQLGYQAELGGKLGGSHLGPPALAGGESCKAEDEFASCDVQKPEDEFWKKNM